MFLQWADVEDFDYSSLDDITIQYTTDHTVHISKQVQLKLVIGYSTIGSLDHTMNYKKHAKVNFISI